MMKYFEQTERFGRLVKKKNVQRFRSKADKTFLL